MLTRSLYRGEVTWNRTRKRNAWGIKRQTGRAEAEWVQLEVPALRIVPEPCNRLGFPVTGSGTVASTLSYP